MRPQLSSVPAPHSIIQASWSPLPLSLTIQLFPTHLPYITHLWTLQLQPGALLLLCQAGWCPLVCHFHHLGLLLPHAQQFVSNPICSVLSGLSTAVLRVGAVCPWLRHRTDSHSGPMRNNLAERQGIYHLGGKESVESSPRHKGSELPLQGDSQSECHAKLRNVGWKPQGKGRPARHGQLSPTVCEVMTLMR